MSGKAELTEKDVHCVARIIQSALFAESLFYGCNYCKYGHECAAGFLETKKTHFEKVRQKLEEITGADLDLLWNGDLEKKFSAYKG